MTWVKLDDQFPQNLKVIEVGPEGVALYVFGLCFCASQLTDGTIPTKAARVLTATADVDPTTVDRLVEAGLWDSTDDGYVVPDFLDYNPSRAQVMRDREQARKRMRRKRGQRPDPEPPPEHSGDVRANNGRSSASPSRPVPSPTSSSSTEVVQQATAGPVDDDDEFMGAVWEAFADRRQRTARITNSVDGWRRSVVNNARSEHGGRAAGLRDRHPHLSAVELARIIDGTDPEPSREPCSTCHDVTLVSTDDGAAPCPDCQAVNA